MSGVPPEGAFDWGPGVDFSNLTEERVAQITEQVAKLSDSDLQKVVAAIEAARVRHARYRTDVEHQRSFISALLQLASAVI